jgi:O-antigen ligase
MAELVERSRARWMLAVMFTAFLLVNVVILTMTFIAGLRGDPSRLPPHMGEEVSLGVRMGLVVVGLLASWFFARMLFQLLVNREDRPSQAVGPSLSLLAYLALLVMAYSFLGFGTWLWLPVLFLFVLVWSMLSLWSLVGFGLMLVGLCVALAGGALTWYMSV